MRRAALLLLVCAGAAAGAPAPAQSLAEAMLAVHNRERALVGAPALAWDPRLAAQAAPWARHLAQLGRLEHSSREARGATGENLAMGTLGAFPAAALAGGWAAEKRDFVDGIFPQVSRTGDWRAVGHYTQMVWAGTGRIGCATATGGGNLYLVCRYAPPGNVIGQRPFQRAEAPSHY